MLERHFGLSGDEDEPPNMDESSHVRQKTDMCGPACAEMLLRFYGINNLTQEDIAFKYGVLKEGWGSPPHRIESFYKRFFTEAGIKENMTLSELDDHLEAGIPATAVFQDVFPEKGGKHLDSKDVNGTLEHGHYVNIIEVHLGDIEDSYVLVADPSNAERQYDENGYVKLVADPNEQFVFRPIYKIRAQIFESVWHDALEDGRVAHGLIIWFDPLSALPSEKPAVA